MLLLIANDGPLPAIHRDHALKGPYAGARECHAGGDLLLVYRYDADGGLEFLRVGTHAQLFE